MLDKELLNYLGKEKKKIFIIVILNCLGLVLSVATTAFFVMAVHLFINNELTVGLEALLFALIAGIFKILTTKYSSSLANKLAEFVTYKLRNETYSKFLSRNGHTPFTVNEMAQLSTEGIEQLRLYYSNFIPSFFYAMIAPILLFILFMFIDIPVAFVYLACVPLIPMSIMAVAKWAKKIFNKYWDLYTSLGDDFLDNTRGMKELKIFKYDEKRQEQMDGSAEGFRKITMKVLTMQLASVTIMDLVAFGGAGIGIVLSLVAMRNGLDPYSTLFMILIGAEFFLPMRALGSAFHVAMNGATAGNKIKTLLKLDDEIDGNEDLNDVNSVRLENLSFGYDDNATILKNINLSFTKGFYSLVGISGSGKSTLAKLMAKVIKPTTGTIYINDQDIYTYKNASFYDKVCYVSAGTYIFHNTIKELFKFYNKDINEEKMKELLHLVKLDHLGLDYIINEEQSNISGGEKQRLTLALYLSKSYDLYIFDEITSNIDIESEEIILDILKELSKDKIVINISHRLKSTSISDHIYYLQDGLIKVHGTFDELLSFDNAFLKLYKVQQDLEVIK